MVTLSDRVRFILVRPSHPGNLGAAARALKNMGWSRLVVVSDTHPDINRAAPMATSARDVLESLEHHLTLESALEGVTFAVATTGRGRRWDFQGYTARELGPVLLPKTSGGDVAILFGQEDSGLDNEAVGRCQAVCEIPTAGKKSLNLAQAVLILSYELMMATGEGEAPSAGGDPAVGLDSLEPVIKSWIEIWEAIEFMKGRNPKQAYATLRQILGRSAIDERELVVLRGYFRKLRHYFVRTGGLPPQSDSPLPPEA